MNPYTGTVVELDRTEDGSGWLVTVTNHKQNGSVLFGWRAYDDQGDAFDMFWRTAESPCSSPPHPGANNHTMEQTNANVDQDDGPVEVSSMPGRVYLGPINGAYLSMTPNEARDIAEVLIDHAALADDGADA